MDLRNKSLNAKKDAEEKTENVVEESGKKPTGKFQKVVIICVVVGVLAVATVATVSFFKDKNKTASKTSDVKVEASTAGTDSSSDVGKEVSSADTTEGDADKPWLSAGSGDSSNSTDTQKPVENLPKLTEPDTKVKPGIKDASKDQYVKNYTDIGKDTFTKDLNGNKVPEHYDIADIKTVVDFVSYTKKRATTDTGIELYWLDATYKGRKCKIQVPFKIFKELDPVGVTVVDVEVTMIPNADTSKDPYEIVTGFTVRSDYKEVLEQAKDNQLGGY